MEAKLHISEKNMQLLMKTHIFAEYWILESIFSTFQSELMLWFYNKHSGCHCAKCKYSGKMTEVRLESFQKLLEIIF